MTARTKWIIAIVGLLALNILAMTVLATAAGPVHLVPGYR